MTRSSLVSLDRPNSFGSLRPSALILILFYCLLCPSTEFFFYLVYCFFYRFWPTRRRLPVSRRISQVDRTNGELLFHELLLRFPFRFSIYFLPSFAQRLECRTTLFTCSLCASAAEFQACESQPGPSPPPNSTKIKTQNKLGKTTQ